MTQQGASLRCTRASSLLDDARAAAIVQEVQSSLLQEYVGFRGREMKHTHQELELSSFVKPKLLGNRSFVLRSLWFLVNALIFQSRLPLAPSSVKSKILRVFGADVGRGLVLKPRVNIKYPWFLVIGDNVWIGENVWIDNSAIIRIGSHVCISQGAYLVTGNHDYKARDFRFFAKPIIIEDRVWICARAVIPPGAVVSANIVVPMNAVWHPTVVESNPGQDDGRSR